MVGIAYANSNAGGVELHNNTETVALQLSVHDEGTYVVFGRIDILNRDGDFQGANAKLTSKNGGNPIDRVFIRIPNDNTRVAVSLQGTLRVGHGATETIEIRCQTFNGFAQESSLIAIQVTELKFG